MKKMMTYVFIIYNIASTSFAADTMQAQLTVWNMTSKPIELHCELLQKNETIYPTPPFFIAVNDSPTIQLIFQRLGKLVRCTTIDPTPAWFVYIAKNADKETIKTSHLTGQPDFHYNPDYPGALTYW